MIFAVGRPFVLGATGRHVGHVASFAVLILRVLEQAAFHFVAPGDRGKPTRMAAPPAGPGRLAGRKVAVIASLKIDRVRSSLPCTALKQSIAKRLGPDKPKQTKAPWMAR